jgi:hypothetical protein
MIEKYQLYGGKITLCYDPETHIYSVNGKQVYGVTNIVGVLNKPGLLYWGVNKTIEYLQNNWLPGKVYDEVEIKNILEAAKKNHSQAKNVAADIGTMIHDWLSNYLKALLERKTPPKKPVNKEMKAAIDGFFRWAKDVKLKVISSERKVYHDKYKYAGTLDLEGIVNGKRTIIDIKTGNSIYPEYFLQASAYLRAIEKENGKQYNGGVVILRLSKKVEEKGQIIVEPFEAVKDERVDLHFKTFLACLQVYRWQMFLKKEAQLKKINSIE